MKIWKFQNNTKKVFKEEILKQIGMGMIFYIVLQVMGEFSEVVSFTSTFKEIGPLQFITMWAFALCLWKFMQEFLDAKVVLEFTRSELMRTLSMKIIENQSKPMKIQ